MAQSMSVRGLVALTILAASSMAQTATPAATSSPSSIISSASSLITSSPDSATPTSSDTPLSLWSVAESLLSSYYPSTTLTQIATLTWPTAVVIDGTTYSAHSGATGGVVGSPATSVLAESTSTATPIPHHGISSDKKLGIIIGVIVGAVAVAVLGIVFCCLWRRKKRSGAYFQRRGTPSISDSEVDAWRGTEPVARSATTWYPSHIMTETTYQGGMQERLAPPPVARHPAYVRQYSSQSSSEDNPFYTPLERSERSNGSYEMEGDQAHDLGTGQQVYPTEFGAGEVVAHQRSISPDRRHSRPTTPFLPTEMMGTSSAVPQQQHHSNPFASLEDDEADDIISPIVPVRSPERRHSPMIHYPSWNEISEFDFNGDQHANQHASQYANQHANQHAKTGLPATTWVRMRRQSMGEDVDDGYRPARGESPIGRHEMA